MAVAVAGISSCGNSTPKASLKSDVDSLSYAIGMSQTQGLKEYLVGRLGVDTAYMDDFIKGLNTGANAGDDKKKAAYYAGIQIGQQISTQMIKGINHEVFGGDSTKSVSLKNFMAGFVSGVKGKNGLMTLEQAGNVAQTKIEEVRAKAMEGQYGEYKKQNEKWLADNAKKEGVKTLPGGVQYKIIKAGNGPMPKDTSMVTVKYEGKTIDGNVFESTLKEANPRPFRLDRMIEGWKDALKNVPEGSVVEIYIPQDKGYGAREGGPIKPFSTLIFNVELLGVDKK